MTSMDRSSAAATRLVQGHSGCPASPFRSAVRARVIHENAAHRLGGDPKKVCSILPPDIALLDEPEECLVDECSRLERVIGTLAPQVSRSLPA